MSLPRPDIGVDILEWWNKHKTILPLLAGMARDHLAIQVSSTPSERLFSACGQILTPRRQNLATSKFSEAIFIQQNILALKGLVKKWEYTFGEEQDSGNLEQAIEAIRDTPEPPAEPVAGPSGLQKASSVASGASYGKYVTIYFYRTL